MKTLKGFIIGGIIFLLLALCFGVYVWLQLQNLSKGEEVPEVIPEKPEEPRSIDAKPTPLLYE